MKKNITILGYGVMGRAIGEAIKRNSKSFRVIGVDINDSVESVKNSDYIILAVKPQNAVEAVERIKSVGIKKDTVMISIMAGISIKKLSSLTAWRKIVRTMPNLGLSVGEGILVWKAEGLSTSEKKEVKKLFDSISENFETKNEDTINKVTAISGSGPAYFFTLAQHIYDSAKGLGLKKDEAKKLVEKTFSASALLAKENKSEYEMLIKRIASKGGTTESALKTFKKEGLEKIINKGILSAYEKAKLLDK